MECRHSSPLRPAPPQNFRVKKSTAKVLALISWHEDGILLIDYLPKGQTISVVYYSTLMVLEIEGHIEGNTPVAGRSPRESCSCTTMPRLSGYLQPIIKLAYPGFHYLYHPFYSRDLSPRLKKKN
jgi:hypothetical protein